MKLSFGILLVSTCVASAAPVSLRYDGRGLASLAYGGAEFVNNGAPAVESAVFAGFNSGSPTSCRSTVSPAEGAVTQTCGSLRVRTAYAAEQDKVLITISVSNTGPYTLERLVLTPLELKFPVRPAEHNGRDPVMGHSFWAPTVLPFHYGSGVLVVVDENVSKPLTVGFPWALDNPVATVYPLKISTGKNPMYPASFPAIERPIAPQASDTYRLSLRFGSSAAGAEQLAADVYRSFAAAHPQVLSWPDRRPIATLFLATAGTGFRGNPRGWFNDPNLNLTTPEGRAEFRRRLLAYARASVAIMSEMNAQGMITWDLEGAEDPQATYIGNPALLAGVAPEMDEFADEYFSVFTSAGLRVGLTLRMQQAVITPARKIIHVAAADPADHLAGLVQYAKRRWGATLFYVDSNDPYDAEVFRRVLAREPGVLLVPEQKSLLHYAYGAPYEDARSGRAATPGEVLRVYPDAFSAINFVDPATLEQRGQQARDRDVLLFPGWYRSAMNARIKSLDELRRPAPQGGVPQLPIAR